MLYNVILEAEYIWIELMKHKNIFEEFHDFIYYIHLYILVLIGELLHGHAKVLLGKNLVLYLLMEV